MNLDRRKFLQIWWVTAVSLALSWCVSNTVTPIKDNTNNIINEDKINKSKESVWNIEFDNFIEFFNIQNNNNLINEIIKIQKEAWIKKDWILWEKTLTFIYLNYYSNSDNINSNINTRLEAYNEMKKYNLVKRNHPKFGILRASNVPKVFKKDYYYWLLSTQNFNDSFIDESLYSVVPDKISELWNKAFLKNINWRFVVSLYVNWELKLASYSSPWNSNVKWWIKTPKWDHFKSTFANKYWISWAAASVKWNRWAVMPYAVNVYSWIFCHAWKVDWTRRSHWCIRLPLLYAKGFHDFFQEYWNISWDIQNS